MLLASIGPAVCCAEDEFRETYDRGRASWQTATQSSQRLIRDQRRQTELAREGSGAEFLRLGVRSQRAVTLVQSLPSVPAAAEPTVTLWLRSNRPATTLALRLVLPNQDDPLTGEPLTCLLPGGVYSETREWQRLSVQATERRTAERLRRLRAELGPKLAGGYLDTRGARIDAACLIATLPAGDTDYVIDDLTYGPILDATPAAVATTRGPTPLQVRGGRATINGQPFFPLATLDHGEPIERLQRAGMNLVWVPDHRDGDRVAALRGGGLRIMATPERAVRNGRVADPAELAPTPYGPETDPVLLWMLGFRVRGDELDEIERSVAQVRASDRLFAQPRPIAADIVDRSRAYSRRLAVVGTSEQVMHTSRTPQDYYFSLAGARQRSLPGSLHMTWIPTEPAPVVLSARSPEAIRPVLEPEQIWMQAYLALAAGYRGLGFWKREPLAGADAQTPGDYERTLAIELLATRLRMLERWLATSKLQSAVPMSVTMANGEPHPHLIASILHSDKGLIVLPMWLPRDGQHCPGQMFARDVRLVIPGWHDARGWEMTTTSLRPMSLRRVAGGSELKLDAIDQNTVVLVTSSTYLPLKNELEMEIVRTRERAAASWVDLAAAKLDRVSRVDGDLQTLGVPRPRDAESRLATARNQVERADAMRDAGGYDEARNLSRFAMQNLRILQREYWENATADLKAPTSSPYALCFQTLPDHYRMTQRLRDTPLGELTASNASFGDAAGLDASLGDRLLPGGQFEDAVETEAAGWRPRPVERDDVRTRVDLALIRRVPSVLTGNADGDTGRCLRMSARPTNAQPQGAAPIVGRTLVVESPTVQVRDGETIQMTARVKATDGASGLVYDTIGGPLLAIPVDAADGWRTVTLLRDVPSETAIGFRFELHGVGELHVDDVRVRRTRPPGPSIVPVAATAGNAQAAADDSGAADGRAGGQLRFLPGLSRFRRDETGNRPGDSNVGSSATATGSRSSRRR